IAEHLRHVREQAIAVKRFNLDLDEEDGVVLPRGPFDVDEPAFLLGAEVLQVRAVGPVHRDSLPTGDEALDLVTGYRRAAAGEFREHTRIGHAADDDRRAGVPGRGPRPAGAGRLGEVLLRAFLP